MLERERVFRDLGVSPKSDCIAMNGGFFGTEPYVPGKKAQPVGDVTDCKGKRYPGRNPDPKKGIKPIPVLTDNGSVVGRSPATPGGAGRHRTPRTGACVDSTGHLVALIAVGGAGITPHGLAECMRRRCPRGSRHVLPDGGGSTQVIRNGNPPRPYPGVRAPEQACSQLDRDLQEVEAGKKVWASRGKLLGAILTFSALLCGCTRGVAKVDVERCCQDDRFPMGTYLVAYGPHGRTYSATDDAMWEQRSGARFSLADVSAVPDAIRISADGKRLILRNPGGWDSYVLDAANLHLLRHLDTVLTWWEGSSLGHIEVDDEGHGRRVVVGQQESPVDTGNTEILVGGSDGKYFLGALPLRSEAAHGERMYRLEMWERTSAGKLRLLHDLATTTGYEPGHMGAPSHFEAFTEDLAVFGFPEGLVDDDFVSVYQGGRATAPLKDPNGRPLVFIGGPIIAGDAIVGLAEAVIVPHLEPSGDRCFYRVTTREASLKPVASNVVLVTYSPAQRAVGFGVADNEGVCVKWGSPPEPSTTQKSGR